MIKLLSTLAATTYLALTLLHQVPSWKWQQSMRSILWPLPQVTHTEQKYRTYSPDPPTTHHIAQITFCGDFECEQPETLYSTKMLNLFLGKASSNQGIARQLTAIKTELSFERWINLTAYTTSNALKSLDLQKKELALQTLRAIGNRLCQNKKIERKNNNSATITFSLEHFEKPFTHSIRAEMPNRIEVQC